MYESINELTRRIVTGRVPHAKAVTRSQELAAWSAAFWTVRTRSGCLETKPLLLAAVQTVVRGAILAVAIDLRVGIVAGSRRAVIPVLSMADTKGVSRTLGIAAARVMFTLTDEPWQSIAGTRAAIHSSNGAAGLGV